MAMAIGYSVVVISFYYVTVFIKADIIGILHCICIVVIPIVVVIQNH